MLSALRRPLRSFSLLPIIGNIIVLFAALGFCATTYDPINSYCARWDHQSVVKNNTLWIDGGQETFDPSGSALYPLGYSKTVGVGAAKQ
jgi:hypothetical protein